MSTQKSADDHLNRPLFTLIRHPTLHLFTRKERNLKRLLWWSNWSLYKESEERLKLKEAWKFR